LLLLEICRPGTGTAVDGDRPAEEERFAKSALDGNDQEREERAGYVVL
jgi:hypothetical protein